MTLAQAIPAISFSKNPIWLKLRSDNYRAAAPVYSVNFLVFNGAVEPGTSLFLGWLNGAATMTAAAVPDDSGLQFPSGDGSAGYVTSLIPYFEGNLFIGSDFAVTTDLTGPNPRLLFTANAPGPDYDFTYNNGGVTGVVTGGASGAPVANFNHYIEIWVGNSAGGFDLAFSSNVPLDQPLTGVTSIDMQDVIDSMIRMLFDRPELTNPYSRCITVLPYYIKAAQFYGATPFVRRVSTFGNYYVAKGGLGKQANLLRTIQLELCPVPANAAKNRFLRQGSINKLVTKDQPEWLTYLHWGAAGNIYPEVAIINNDQTNFTFNPYGGPIAVNQYDKIQFRVGFMDLAIGTRQSADKHPVYYSFYIISDAGQVTELYSFVIDQVYREWPKYFVYENSYGAFQTIATVGKGQAETDRTKDDAQIITDANTAAIAGEFLEVNIRIQDKFTVNIGYDRAGKRNIALLRDLLLSHKIYLYQDGVLIPIGLNTKNLKDAMDGTNVYANSFEYYPLYEEQVYTEDPAVVMDDTVDELLSDAGTLDDVTAVPGLNEGTLVVESNDTRLSIANGQQTYLAPYWLAGKTGYRVACTQLGVGGDAAPFFRTEDISYNQAAGSFTILVPGFVLQPGEQLIVFPYVLDPGPALTPATINFTIVENPPGPSFVDVGLQILDNGIRVIYEELSFAGVYVIQPGHSIAFTADSYGPSTSASPKLTMIVTKKSAGQSEPTTVFSQTIDPVVVNTTLTYLATAESGAVYTFSVTGQDGGENAPTINIPDTVIQ